MSKISKVKQLNVINVDIKESYHKENINESVSIEKSISIDINIFLIEFSINIYLIKKIL